MRYRCRRETLLDTVHAHRLLPGVAVRRPQKLIVTLNGINGCAVYGTAAGSVHTTTVQADPRSFMITFKLPEFMVKLAVICSLLLGLASIAVAGEI